ncbi:hypothetical protein HPC49_37185 [Pyxidicoccus fallax]|uniref:Uncharacterized protein n=1 Tax=Pyxidicoccus fallax TaxID=394095 RepID=A0A848L8X9_9BACT|nr:hypothetical protein [Pyxidicoccus fallax]NMO15007.1 hypothetical protein [Pyxidicoccus fallax]NPC83839.1 hypothetical protein [Pyxidicoccus fallax]
MNFTKLMLKTALVMVTVFLVLHIVGGIQFLGVFSKELESGTPGMIFGVLCTLSWVALVLMVPVLLLVGLANAAHALSRIRPTRRR